MRGGHYNVHALMALLLDANRPPREAPRTSSCHGRQAACQAKAGPGNLGLELRPCHDRTSGSALIDSGHPAVAMNPGAPNRRFSSRTISPAALRRPARRLAFHRDVCPHCDARIPAVRLLHWRLKPTGSRTIRTLIQAPIDRYLACARSSILSFVASR